MRKAKYPIFKSLHHGEKGFTLIELLIVVAILGIIAAVVIPNISGFMITGELSAANSEVEQVKTAILGYFGDNGEWPTTSANLTPTYLSGTPKAIYDVSDNYGWLVDIISSNWSAEIYFTGAVDTAEGCHGHWARNTT